jgi:hypothetical protein
MRLTLATFTTGLVLGALLISTAACSTTPPPPPTPGTVQRPSSPGGFAGFYAQISSVITLRRVCRSRLGVAQKWIHSAHRTRRNSGSRSRPTLSWRVRPVTRYAASPPSIGAAQWLSLL